MGELIPAHFIPLQRGTVAWGLSRERLLRKIASGEIEGGYFGKHWYVAAPRKRGRRAKNGSRPTDDSDRRPAA